MPIEKGSHGCKRYGKYRKEASFPVEELCPWDDLTSHQKEIIKTVLSRFPNLRVSAPSWWQKTEVIVIANYSEVHHHKDLDNGSNAGWAIDFVHKDGGPHPDLANAYFWLWENNWNGGLGIAFGNNFHLHVDKNPRGRTRWIEVGESKDDYIYQSNPNFEIYLAHIRSQYNFLGDGTEALLTDSSSYESKRSIIPGVAIGAAVGGVMSRHWIGAVGGAVAGAVVNEILNDFRNYWKI